MRIRQGFTLIELLVVISIIAILAGLLLPAIVDAQTNAQQLQAKSNIKQISASLFQYQEEYNSAPRIASYGSDPVSNGNVVVEGMELLASVHNLSYELFNSKGTGVSISDPPETVANIYGGTTAWSAPELSYGWDFSAPTAASNSVRVMLAERSGAWGGTQVAVVYGDHSATDIKSEDPDAATLVHYNDKVRDEDDIFTGTGDTAKTQIFGGGNRNRAYVRFDGVGTAGD